MIKIKLTLDDL